MSALSVQRSKGSTSSKAVEHSFGTAVVRQTPQLSYEFIRASEKPTHVAVMIHGILGSKRNMMSFARRIVQLFPHFAVLLVDLRNHGDSKGFSPPHDLKACAEDISVLLSGMALFPTMLIGHSFGGKVALACSDLGLAQQVWVLDTPPGDIWSNKDRISSAQQVIDVIKGMRPPFASRKEVVDRLFTAGINQKIASWMTTNLRQTESGLVWTFDLQAIDEMLESYAKTSFWPLLDQNTRQIHYDFVRAQQEDRFSEADITHFSKLEQKGLVRLHVLENAGHWVHVDNPEGLLEMMKPSFAVFR